MQGQKIKIRLLQLRKKQRWLLNQLRQRGFGKLSEPHLSDILNGIYVSGNAAEILEAAEQILSEQEKLSA